MLSGPISTATIRTSLVLMLRFLVQSAALLLIARMLGPEKLGAFAAVAALAVMAGTLSSFGTNLMLLSEISKDPVRREQVLPYAIPTTLVGGCFFLLVFVLLCRLVLYDSGVSIGVLVAIGAVEILLLPLFGLVVSELLALEYTAHSQLLQSLPLTLRPAAAALVMVLHFTDPLMAYAYIYFVGTIIAFLIVVRRLPAPWPELGRWRWPRRKELRATAGYALLNISALGPAEVDKALAMRFLPLHAAGIYAISARLVSAVTLPVVALMLSALPRLFREQEPSKSLRRLLGWIYIAALSYSVIISVVLWFLVPLLVWLLGSEYKGVEDVVRLLCFALPGMALRIAAGSALMAFGRPWMRFGFEGVGVFVLIVAALALTKFLGPMGMPLALACSEWAMAILGSWLITQVRPNT